MLTKNIKQLPIPTLGLGCMRLPKIDPKQDQINYQLANEMVDYAYQQGIRYYDTAYIYHGGDSERFIGQALKKYPRESFYLANKMPLWVCKNLDDVKRVFEDQLAKCQVEYFDFYLCHAMSLRRHHQFIAMGAYQYLIEMKKQGKIKYLGFSYHDIATNIVELLDYYQWDFVQIQINYLDYQLQNAKFLYEEITRRNIEIIVMEPIRGGLLANLPSDAQKLLSTLQPQLSYASWALRWVASIPNIKIVLSGMSNLEQLKDNINTFNDFQPISDDECVALEQVVEMIKGDRFIPCTGCRYCLPCPAGVDIPLIFENYNEANITKTSFLKRYQQINPSKLASNCIGCHRCEKQCPQQIKIAQQLKLIDQEVNNG